MIEIGSEFHENSAQIGQNLFSFGYDYADVRYVQSGRTGLDLISDELLSLENITTIALPEYCCAAMVYPFYNKGFSVIFYPNPSNFESADNEDIDRAMSEINKADVVLVMDYFGFVRDFTFQIADKAKKNNKKIIVDATQSGFSKSQTYAIADYVLISYRKWTDLLCAAVYSSSSFVTAPYKNCFDIYNNIWKNAANIKRQYLDNQNCEKSEYLSLYKQANYLLSVNYEKYSSSNDEIVRLKQIDSAFLISKRRENAAYIINELNRCKEKYNIELLFNQLYDDDCPLFVPILVDEVKRDLIRKKLISKDIFCPAHWPIDKKYPFMITSYHCRELSLVCDQRYDIEDMKREICELISAFNEV